MRLSDIAGTEGEAEESPSRWRQILEDEDAPPVAANPMQEKVIQRLHANLGPKLMDHTLTQRDLYRLVSTELNVIVGEMNLPLTPSERARLIESVMDEALRLGPLEELLADETVTEIMVNGCDKVFIERGGKVTLSNVKFDSNEALRKIIERIVTGVGRRIDEASPTVDARLTDGSRVNAVIPPIALDGPSLTIRKFPSNPLTIGNLIAYGTLDLRLADFLRAAVQTKQNILVSGGTGTGKTTLLNILSGFIPDGERVVSIEDAAELQLKQPNLVRMESRPPNVEGKGAIPIRALVENALRMRPDRLVVGECRGGEALDMLQAMNTGHDGSMSTIHANSPRDTLSRLETLVLMAGADLPSRAIREQIASAIKLIVQISRLPGGSRKVTSVTEVVGMEKDVIQTQEIFTFDQEGVDSDGQVIGVTRPTGLRPRMVEKMAENGIVLPPSTFGW